MDDVLICVFTGRGHSNDRYVLFSSMLEFTSVYSNTTIVYKSTVGSHIKYSS